MSATTKLCSAGQFKTCRHCLGEGCLHCNHKGGVPMRTFRRLDPEAAAVLSWLRAGQPDLGKPTQFNLGHDLMSALAAGERRAA